MDSYSSQFSVARLWKILVVSMIVMFGVLLYYGNQIYHLAPPIPNAVKSDDGVTLFTREQIDRGQSVWQSMGGMQQGSIWGHGSYVAPDWSADWLHREALALLDRIAMQDKEGSYVSLSAADQASARTMLRQSMRTNTYDAQSGVVTVTNDRAEAIAVVGAHYAALFQGSSPEGQALRAQYAFPLNAKLKADESAALNAFFFWTSWAASTERPGNTITYTSNWPHEPLVANRPTPDVIVWTGVSILMLLAGIGLMAFWHAAQPADPPDRQAPETDPLLGAATFPSQRATRKYFWTVTALMLLQIAVGMVTAHYGVEGDGFYGWKIDQVLPYSVARTWHVQLGIFWIATTWLAAGLYIGPAVGGAEPRFQRLGVNVLFGALLVVVLGSMAGQWLSVKQLLGSGTLWFYFGHSGYEYIDLGRAWQIALLVGLFLWLALMIRALLPALRRRDEQRTILALFAISAVAIAGFYGAALGAGQHTNLAVAEYWRWWVVHLWVEGFFEVFATVIIAFLFARLGLVSLVSAGRNSVLASTIYLAGGIIGTLHHLYFSGTPTMVLALGSVFSALEVVPLLFVGFEAWHNLKLSDRAPWVQKYRWPISFFVAVAFWNLVGAWLFGFMINPPVALYYMQGLNTTPVHGHAALFGVYGLLGIGLMLFALRALRPGEVWRDGLLRFSFWSLNVGLFAMVVISLLPVGLMQTWAAVEHGYWYARSPEFLQSPVLNTFRWLRVVGDTIFTAGVVALVLFVYGLITGHSTRVEATTPAGAAVRLPVR